MPMSVLVCGLGVGIGVVGVDHKICAEGNSRGRLWGGSAIARDIIGLVRG